VRGLNVINVIVDEMPKGCTECQFGVSIEYPSSYHCAALSNGNETARINYDMHDYRRHDCSLKIDNA
jgi:hypothetical protein